MKLLRISPLCLLAGTALAGSIFAAPTSGGSNFGNQARPPQNSQPRPLRGGFAIHLETSHVRVVIPAKPAEDEASPTATPARTPPPPHVAVSAALENKSRADIAIGYASKEAAQQQFTFRLVDSAGEVLWSNEAEEEDDDAEAVEMLLRRGKALRKLVRVPLILEEAPLPAGTYVIEAGAGADGVATASVTFEVVESVEGEKPPADDQLPPADDQRPPADDQRPAADGQRSAADGQRPPADGQRPPADGQRPPADGQRPPADGQRPPRPDGQRPPSDGQRPPAR